MMQSIELIVGFCALGQNERTYIVLQVNGALGFNTRFFLSLYDRKKNALAVFFLYQCYMMF
jgi:hypothetical protein